MGACGLDNMDIDLETCSSQGSAGVNGVWIRGVERMDMGCDFMGLVQAFTDRIASQVLYRAYGSVARALLAAFHE